MNNPDNATNKALVSSGLEGVVAAETALSMVDGARGELVIAGYPVAELALNATFEQAVWLLWHGALPDASELSELSGDLYARRQLLPAALELLRAAASARVDAMDAMRLAAGTVSLRGATAPAQATGTQPAQRDE